MDSTPRLRLKIPPDVAICPMDGEAVSTDGREVVCKAGCRSPIERWRSKAMRKWKREAKRWLEGLA